MLKYVGIIAFFIMCAYILTSTTFGNVIVALVIIGLILWFLSTRSGPQWRRRGNRYYYRNRSRKIFWP